MYGEERKRKRKRKVVGGGLQLPGRHEVRRMCTKYGRLALENS